MSTYKLDRTGAQIKADLALARAALPVTGGTLGTYAETGATLAFVAAASGDIAIPLDGKIYALVITGDCDLVTGTAPTAPVCGSVVVYIDIDTATPPVITVPAAWLWPDGVVTSIATADNAVTRLMLYTDPAGRVHADADWRATA